MKKRLKITTGIVLSACVMAMNVMPVYAGDGLYSALSSIYGTSGSSDSNTTASSIVSNVTGTMSNVVGSLSGSTGSGGASMPQNRRVITYYPLYNMQQQQQLNANQQATNIIRQTYDVSGNSVFSSDISGNSAIVNQYNKINQALTPDIAALESDPVGPTVNSISLSETYHEDYKIYEEKFGDIYTIYSNISNGTIVNHYVMFDFPRGVMARMTRDGVSCDLANKTKIEAEGTYNIQFFYAKEGYENVPGWQQEIDSARFAFRIQYTAGLDGEPLEWDDQSELESFADLVNEGDYPAKDQPEAETEEANQIMPAPEAEPDAAAADDVRLSSTYDMTSGYYKYTLKTGDVFYSSVPDGMITNDAVIFQAEDDIQMNLYKDGVQVEYSAGDFINDPGSYTLIPVMDKVEYENYYRGNRPMLHFRIVTGPTSDLSVVSAPDGMIIEAVRLDYEDITDTAMASYKVVYLSEDGNYEVDMRDDSGRNTVSIIRDTQAPKITVATAPNQADIAYQSADIDNVIISRGETVVSEGNMVSRITEAGRYHILVKDKAGNTTEKDFVVKYRINIAAILAILAVVALGIAFFLYMKKVKTSVRVR